MGYYQVKIEDLKSKTLSTMMYCKKGYAKNVIRKISCDKDYVAEIFVETDDKITYTTTICVCDKDVMLAKYIFTYTEADSDIANCDWYIFDNREIKKEMHIKNGEVNGKEYDEQGRLLARVVDNQDTLHIYKWNTNGVLDTRFTYMNGYLHHTVKYEYNASTKTYSSKVFGYDGKLLNTSEPIEEKKFYR